MEGSVLSFLKAEWKVSRWTFKLNWLRGILRWLLVEVNSTTCVIWSLLLPLSAHLFTGYWQKLKNFVPAVIWFALEWWIKKLFEPVFIYCWIKQNLFHKIKIPLYNKYDHNIHSEDKYVVQLHVSYDHCYCPYLLIYLLVIDKNIRKILKLILTHLNKKIILK
jgi:hypothetical protein